MTHHSSLIDHVTTHVTSQITDSTDDLAVYEFYFSNELTDLHSNAFELGTDVTKLRERTLEWPILVFVREVW